MAENFLLAQWCSQVLTTAMIARSSFHTIFIFASSDEQQTCIHLQHQYAPHPAELAALVYSDMEVEVDHSVSSTGKTLCKYGPVFVPYLHNWTLYGINTVQKRVRIYMAFFLCSVQEVLSQDGRRVSHHSVSRWACLFNLMCGVSGIRCNLYC